MRSVQSIQHFIRKQQELVRNKARTRNILCQCAVLRACALVDLFAVRFIRADMDPWHWNSCGYGILGKDGPLGNSHNIGLWCPNCLLVILVMLCLFNFRFQHIVSSWWYINLNLGYIVMPGSTSLAYSMEHLWKDALRHCKVSVCPWQEYAPFWEMEDIEPRKADPNSIQGILQKRNMAMQGIWRDPGSPNSVIKQDAMTFD